MIGSLISMKFVGKKNWLLSFYFWLVIIFAGIIIGLTIPIGGIILSILIYLLVAHYIFKCPWIISIAVYVIGFIIDIIIIFAILAIFGFSAAFLLGLGGLV